MTSALAFLVLVVCLATLGRTLGPFTLLLAEALWERLRPVRTRYRGSVDRVYRETFGATLIETLMTVVIIGAGLVVAGVFLARL